MFVADCCKQFAAVFIKHISNEYNKSGSVIEKKSTFEDILSFVMREFLRMPRSFFLCVFLFIEYYY